VATSPGSRYSPFGYFYDKIKKRLEIVPEEAEIVRSIFTKYLSGLSTQKIAGELYKQKIQTRSGGSFSSSLVRKILRNKIHIGKLVWNAHHYDRKQKTVNGYRYVKNDPSQVIEAQGLHEAIVSEDVFYQVQTILDRNRKGSFARKRLREYPLSGVITCVKCGYGYLGASNVKNHKTGEKRPYYRCSSRAKHDIKCGNGDVRAELLETRVFEILDTLFSSEGVSKERMRNLVMDQCRERATDQVSRELEQLKEQLKNCQLKQSKLTDTYLESMISREIFEEKNQKLRNEEGEIRIKIERMELQLIEKEQSKEYIKRAEEVVKSTKSIQENLHPVLRKELLKLVFKKLPVEDRAIGKFELYEPFNAMHQNALAAQKANPKRERRDKNWMNALNTTQSQVIGNQSCLSRPSAAR